MMTDQFDEKAEEIVDEFHPWLSSRGTTDLRNLERLIATAIRSAVEAEREAITKTADDAAKDLDKMAQTEYSRRGSTAYATQAWIKSSALMQFASAIRSRTAKENDRDDYHCASAGFGEEKADG